MRIAPGSRRPRRREPPAHLGVDVAARNFHVERRRVQAGSELTQAGLSHSCDRQTSARPASSAQTISVPLARRETTRMVTSLRSLSTIRFRTAQLLSGSSESNGRSAEFVENAEFLRDRLGRELLPEFFLDSEYRSGIEFHRRSRNC